MRTVGDVAPYKGAGGSICKEWSRPIYIWQNIWYNEGIVLERERRTGYETIFAIFVFAYLCVGDLLQALEPARAVGLIVTFVVLMTALLFLALEAHLALRGRVNALETRVVTLEEEMEKKPATSDGE